MNIRYFNLLFKIFKFDECNWIVSRTHRKTETGVNINFIGEYAATNEAEFFAVITERFYESPESLKKHFPDLYKELKDFYHVDPAEKT